MYQRPATTPYCDHIFEVAHPLRSWGKSALVANLPNRPGGSIYRVMASADNTNVFLDENLQTVLSKGQFFQAGPLTGSHIFEASEPIAVTQFMTGSTSPGASLGDPAMANMIPPDQYLDAYTSSTVGGTEFSAHFLTVIAPTNSIGSLGLDGGAIPAGQFTPIGTTGFSSAIVPLSEGSHTGARVDQRGINDWTPLHYAAATGDRRAIRLLLAGGADPGARARIDNGTLPLDEAANHGHGAAVRVLKQAVARAGS